MTPSSSCHITEIKYDVFISFRGTDVRRGLLSYLKKELRRMQIYAYVDDRLEKGDEISPSLLRAIQESQVSLVIFSKDYASSKWCLEELAKIIECMGRNKQIVIPVFYSVNPSDVRHQRGDYGSALAKHEGNFKENMAMVQKWRSALEKAAQLSGFHYPSNFEDESDLVDEIVQVVLKKLSKFCPSKSYGLVGIDQNIARIESLLALESQEVKILGIWGMGGIGKTTIAHAVFDKFSLHYDGHCFLENIREEMEKHQLSYLYEKLLYELLEEETLHKNGKSIARSSFSKTRLSRKKVLVVLDDVNTPEQLKYLVGEPICFGPGSRVIVTSRDRHVLTSGGVHEIHQVQELNLLESLKLFCLTAFNETHPKTEYEDLSKQAVDIAKGIPLALKILGSYFHSKSRDTWECALRKLKKYPNEKIHSVLRLSYDGLDDIEKNVFLDIAFFFKEEDKDYVIRQLDAFGFFGASGIEALLSKALITISKDNRIQMHDLIQEMGWEIIRQESNEDPRQCSRLRDNKEVYDVLKNNKENDVVEGMLIDASKIEDVPLSHDTFKKMPNLRFLKLYCPLKVEFSLLPSLVKQLLKGMLLDCVNLKRMGLCRCRKLAELLQFSKAPTLECTIVNNGDSLQDPLNLKTLIIRGSRQFTKHLDLPVGCTFEGAYNFIEFEDLCDIPPSSLSVQTQVTSVLPGCKELIMSTGSEIHIKFLDHLMLEGLLGKKEFSVLLKKIRQLNLTNAGMEILNSSIHFNNLECLNLDCLCLKNHPNKLFGLRSTHYLRLSNCGGQDIGKTKLHILFDGLWFSRRLAKQKLYILPDGL